MALVETYVDRHKNREVAEAFLAFLLSADGQRILAEYGFRPVDPQVSDATGRSVTKSRVLAPIDGEIESVKGANVVIRSLERMKN